MIRDAEPEWSHLQRVIDELVSSGNATRDGMQPNQGGFDCFMAQDFDQAVISAALVTDEHRAKITVTDTQVFCRHCWASIHGPG